MFNFLETTPTLKLKKSLSDSEVDKICRTYREKIGELTSEEPVASIVVPAYDEEMYLLGMLEHMSLLETNYPLEFIGVDNNSNDRTGRIFEQSGFKLIHESRKGTSFARQAGLLAAKGKYIFTTDADTLVPATWVDSSLQYFDLDQELVCLSGGAGTCWPGTIKIYQSMRKMLHYVQKFSGKKTYQTQNFPGHNSVFRKDIALSVGGYEAGSDMGEDNILARKIGHYGKLLRVDNNPEIQVVSSGRRTASIPLVFKMLCERSQYLFADNENHPRSKTFTDVR